MLNFRAISNVVGVTLLIVGLFMLTCIPISIMYDGEHFGAMLSSAILTLVVGFSLWKIKFGEKVQVTKRDGYMIVVSTWVSMSIFCALPYFFSGVIDGLAACFFESVSGVTTTGASVLTDIESVSSEILFWRSLTQWIGGMGIIVLTVAIFPLLGIGGIELFVAEAPGPTADKIHPRIRETAKRLYAIYVGLTVVLTSVYYVCGMNFYDAINHSLTTMSTGGFSTKNASMMAFSPLIQWVCIVFMFIAGTNYTILYFGLTGRFRRVWYNDEFRAYAFFVLLLIFLVGFAVCAVGPESLSKSFRDAAFQIISLITTTGYVSADYTKWAHGLTLLMFVLLFCGACAGSTSGGIKIIRHLIFLKNSMLEFKRLLHPRAVIRIKLDKQVVPPRILTHILVFLLIYLMIFVLGSVIMGGILRHTSEPLLTAMGAAATCLGNVGPAIGNVGPVDNFSSIPASGHWFLSLLMLLGRLELFSILVLFSPSYWKAN